MDLQENVREKEEVIQSRNRAFKLIAEELSQNRAQISEKDTLIRELQEKSGSGALADDGANQRNCDVASLKVSAPSL